MAHYRLGSLLIGKSIPPPPTPPTLSIRSSSQWTIPAGIYTPKQLVHAFSPLLNTVLHHLGPDPDPSKPARTLLLDNIAANLATDTRESSLSLPSSIQDPSRLEISTQAHRITTHLLKWAHESTTSPSSSSSNHVDLSLRSPCEGHLLLPVNVDLMFGPRSKPPLMQLFNEYMHQMILLRDSLLPFQNYQDIPIPIPGENVRGMRFMESAREKFLTALFTKHVTQSSVVRLARALLIPHLERVLVEGYGFQYEHGVVIPAVFGGGKPLHLLQYLPARVEERGKEMVFQYEFGNYFGAPRVEVGSGLSSPSSMAFPFSGGEKEQGKVIGKALIVQNYAPADKTGELKLKLTFDDNEACEVDVGQIARGFRYAYQAQPDGDGSGEIEEVGPLVMHSASDILNKGKGLVVEKEGEGGVHVIPVQERIVALAVLGRLYPGNVVGLDRELGLERTVGVGKSYGPAKFVIWG